MLKNPWIPHKPHPKQAAFLLLNCREALYGGAAGGGKSEALLMASLQYVDVPNYSAIIFRRSFTDLALPGALMDRSHEWLTASDAHYNNINHSWTFPSGAALAFGNLEHENDKYRYQSAEFQYIGFDELTQFTETQYRYLFSRLRRTHDSLIPLRMRGASNPGNIGHDWVRQRFMIEGPEHSRVFIPAKLEDNPSLDQARYIENLSELDPITRRQYLDGDWTARHGGSIFLREWFVGQYGEHIKRPAEVPSDLKKVRYWDKASTEPHQHNREPDYTAGLLLGAKQGQYWVLDIRRFRKPPPMVEAIIRETAVQDGASTSIYMEQEPGSSGADTISHYSRNVLAGFEFRGVKTSGPKTLRAGPVASAAEAGNIFIVQAPWNSTFLEELEAFPDGMHDDQVDALSGAFSKATTSYQPWAKTVNW